MSIQAALAPLYVQVVLTFVTGNQVAARFSVFVAGAVVLAAMWAIFILRILIVP